MHFALEIPIADFAPGAPEGGLAVARKMAGALEDAGLSAGLMSEHPVPSAAWLRTDPTAHDCLDPLTALAIVAACTVRLKLLTNVLVLPYRNPFLTAKAAATLQILSDNRLLLGVGTGYQREEFEALGVPFAERGALTDEAIETLRAAWAGGEIVKKGRHFDAPGNEPRPVPSPPPPIWVGGGSDKAIARAARLGDGWAPYFTVPTNDATVQRSALVSMKQFGEKVARLRELREASGRSGPFTLAVAPPFRPKKTGTSEAQRFIEEVQQLAGFGVDWIWTSCPSQSLPAYLDFVAWFGEEIVAAFGQDAAA